MDERERRRLLRHLIGHEDIPDVDRAYAIAEATRAAMDEVQHVVGHMIHDAIDRILRDWGYDTTANLDGQVAITLRRTGVHDTRAMAAFTFVVAEIPPNATSMRQGEAASVRVAEVTGGYELVVKDGALGFQPHMLPPMSGTGLAVRADAATPASPALEA